MLKDKVMKAWFDKEKGYGISISAKIIDEKLEHRITFIVVKENQYVEWIPRYGPITIIEKSDNVEDEYRGEDYIFNFNKGRGNWTQIACDDLALDDAFVNGEYKYIFTSLQDYLHEGDN